ncbi:putative quinol monooxygenase [Dongia deserti]|uniref:putative quinol monooxygenase n=1 Tax=Dongia deserti TaxID=2268030 RepID=UPI000E64CDBF|nr:putative quinol monooxygenase [Dongia deserti]
MNGFVIMVDFRLKPGARSDFRRLIDENARASCRDEPGCRRFDVLESPSDTDRIVLYEIYDDRAAFQAHVNTSHFARFNEASADLVADKKVTELNLVCEGSAA